MKYQDSFLKNVLSHVKFSEAHSEIRKELESHISEIRETYADVIQDEGRLQEQVRKRMGNPDEIGTQLDMLHRPKVDWNLVIPISILLVVGLYMMKQLNFFSSHGLWIAIGMASASIFTFLKPGRFLKYSPIGFAAVFILTIISFFSSTYSDGQPYLSVAGINIKIIDLSAALFSIFVPGMVQLSKRMRFAPYLVYPVLALPLFVYSKTGSSFPLVVYGITLLGILNVYSSHLLPILTVLFCGLMSLMLWPKAGEQFVSATNIEFVRQLETHTDFVLNSVYQISPVASALAVVCAILFCLRLFSVVQVVRNQEGKALVTGIGLFLTLATLWSCLASLGFLPLPVAGINLPFVSYGGSLMIAQLSMVGLVLGIYRRKNLSDLEWLE